MSRHKAELADKHIPSVQTVFTVTLPEPLAEELEFLRQGQGGMAEDLIVEAVRTKVVPFHEPPSPEPAGPKGQGCALSAGDTVFNAELVDGEYIFDATVTYPDGTRRAVELRIVSGSGKTKITAEHMGYAGSDTPGRYRG